MCKIPESTHSRGRSKGLQGEKVRILAGIYNNCFPCFPRGDVNNISQLGGYPASLGRGGMGGRERGGGRGGREGGSEGGREGGRGGREGGRGRDGGE